MKTFKSMEIWDGNCIFPKAATDALIGAFIDFTKGLAAAPDSHFLGLWTYNPEAKDIFVLAILTSFDGVENPKSLQRFLEIPGQKDMKRTTIPQKMIDFRMPAGQQ